MKKEKNVNQENSVKQGNRVEQENRVKQENNVKQENSVKHVWNLTKAGLIKSGILTVVLLVLTGMAVYAEGTGGWCLPLALLLSVAAGAYCLLNFQFKRVLSVITALIIPFLSFYCLQWYTCDPWRVYPMMVLLNCIFFYLFYLAVSFLLGRFKWGYIICSAFCMIVGIANYFVVEFRSAPIVPWDLMSMGTAASVADNYTYTISWRFLFVSFGFAFLLLTAAKNTLKLKSWKIKLPGFIVALVLLIGSMSAIQSDTVKDFFGMDQTLFTPNVRYRNNGFMAAFIGNLHLINIAEPKGYSVAKVEEIQQTIVENIAASGANATDTEANMTGSETNTTGSEANTTGSEANTTASEANVTDSETNAATSGAATTNTGANASADVSVQTTDLSKAPNIIIVMNEAFSDLSVLGDFNTNEDYMPFFHSLMNETSSGHLMVSVKGGNTANTEYEFLSGDSMAFLPTGSVVYQQYIKDAVPSLPTYLKSLGYATTAIHPYYASGWDRDTVYPLLGFDEFLDVESFEDPTYVRNYISDESAFDKIIDVFENKKEGEPQFIFEVTMQNHSGYSKDFPGFEATIDLTDFNTTSTSIQAAEKYLTLIQDSDKAFERLISYFEKVEEPTIIVMFGDHQPSDYITNVISRITGYDPESTSLEEYQKSFEVPYVIWSNYGLEKIDEDPVSVNYLGATILERAGLPLTQYQDYLLSLKEELPVICAGTYIDKDGTYHAWSEKDTDETYGTLLNDYNILTYNHLTDAKHRVEDLFTTTAE